MRKGSREAVNLSREQGDFIRRRVSILLQPDRAIIDLIADGYVQGMSDALELQKREQPQ